MLVEAVMKAVEEVEEYSELLALHWLGQIAQQQEPQRFRRKLLVLCR
tara:strand:- start:15 stop:155 length:141 start_codon:yes stop_codon:yes gene_type:complete